MTYSLLSTLVLALKNFLANFDTSFGIDRTYAGGSRSGGNGYGLKRLTRSGKNNSQKHRYEVDLLEGPQDSKYTARIFHSDSHQERPPSARSGNSQKPIIRREVQYSVASEERLEGHSSSP
jgi:hypothetical protein